MHTSKLACPQPVAILNLSALDNAAALNLYFFGNHSMHTTDLRGNISHHASFAGEPTVVLNERNVPSLMFRKSYSTQNNNKSDNKEPSPFIVCVGKDGKGCISPGNADLPKYDPSSTADTASTSKGDKSSSDSQDPCGFSAKPTIKIAQSPFEDCGFTLLSCDAYRLAISNAAKSKLASACDGIKVDACTNPTVVYSCGGAQADIMLSKDKCKDDPCKEAPNPCADPCEEMLKKKSEPAAPQKRKRNQMPTGCVSPKCQKKPSEPGSGAGGCRAMHYHPLAISGSHYSSVRCYSCNSADEKLKKMEEALKKQEEELKKMCEEAKKAEEDAKKLCEDAKKKEEEAKKMCEELKKKEDECKKAADEAKKKEEECKKCIDELKKKSEDAQKCAEATKKAAEEAKKKAEELKKAVEEAKKCLEEAKKDLEDAKKCAEAKKVLTECKNKKKNKKGGCGGDPCKDKEKKSPCASSKPSKPSCGGKGFATYASAEPITTTTDTSNLVKRNYGTFKLHNGLTIENFGFDPRFFSSKKNESSGRKCGKGTVMPKNRKKDPNARPKDGLRTDCFEDGECDKREKDNACDKQSSVPGGCQKNNKGIININT